MPYSSKSGSFLHIRDPEGELPCGHSQLFHVDSILGKEALGSELKNLDLVFMVSPGPGKEGSSNWAVVWEWPHLHRWSQWCPQGQYNDQPVLERLRDLSEEAAAATVVPAPPWEMGSWRLGMVKNHPRTLIMGPSSIRALGFHPQHPFCSHPLLCRSWPRGPLPASSGKRSLQNLVCPMAWRGCAGLCSLFLLLTEPWNGWVRRALQAHPGLGHLALSQGAPSSVQPSVGHFQLQFLWVTSLSFPWPRTEGLPLPGAAHWAGAGTPGQASGLHGAAQRRDSG